MVREERIAEESSSEASTSDGEPSGGEQCMLSDVISLRVRLEHDDRSVVYIIDGT